MPWRTKVGGASPVEHLTREAADACVDALRQRYRAGATRVRLVRMYDEDGGVRLVDFAAELKDSSRALRDLERATDAKDRAVLEVIERWERAVRHAVELGQSIDDVATAAGLTPTQVRALLAKG